MTELERIDRAAAYIKEVLGEAKIAVVLGSGLGDYAEALEDARMIPYDEIPGFPESTVPGHAGELWAGTLHGKRVLMMRGRFHAYEGHDLADIVLPARAMARLGVETLILTNAAGAVNTAFAPGDLMMITDHINLSGRNPLVGRNIEELGPRFPDMSRAYDRRLQAIACEVAQENGIPLRQGVYAWFLGPTFETPAEVRMARILGADAVGMSTVPEAIAAVHAGMHVLGLSCLTNMAAGILDQPLTHQEVMETGARVRGTFRALVDGVIARIDA
ncbi:MAG: purine-nucleoside phosphorylase [Clostridia bacterium]|nr:purine-nucleoside phosphorylase [Clostridia bacterium]